MELEQPLQPGQRQQAIRQIREAFSSIDSLVQHANRVAAELEALQAENRQKRQVYVQQEQQAREITDNMSKKNSEIQKALQGMQRTERKFDLMKHIAENDGADDRLLQVKILQHKLTVAQEELEAKELIVRQLQRTISEGYNTLVSFNQPIVDIERKMASMGITEGNSSRPEIQLLDQKIKQMEHKLYLADLCINDMQKLVQFGQKPPRQATTQPLSRSASSVSSNHGLPPRPETHSHPSVPSSPMNYAGLSQPHSPSTYQAAPGVRPGSFGYGYQDY